MRKKFFALSAFTLILLCLTGLSGIYIQPIKGQNDGIITISANGNITPPSAPIEKKGNIYSLTSDYNGSITIGGSNLIFDGNGHTVTGTIQVGNSCQIHGRIHLMSQ